LPEADKEANDVVLLPRHSAHCVLSEARCDVANALQSRKVKAAQPPSLHQNVFGKAQRIFLPKGHRSEAPVARQRHGGNFIAQPLIVVGAHHIGEDKVEVANIAVDAKAAERLLQRAGIARGPMQRPAGHADQQHVHVIRRTS
jgi:hypothetical protein